SMRTAMSLLASSLLGLGLSGAAHAGVLSDLLAAVPVPQLAISCFEPADGDTPANASARTQRERHDAAPTSAAPAVEPEHARDEEIAPQASPGEAASDFSKSARGRSTRWKALLPGALK